MLFGICATLFALCAILMMLVILMQKGKGGMGLGSMGGSSQMLFGSGGGQDLFQKMTWVLGALLIFGSLGLAIWKAKEVGAGSGLLRQHQEHPLTPAPVIDDV